MDRNNSTRTNLSLITSMLLHGSVIALIALGPALIPGMSGKSDRQSSTVEFSVNDQSVPNTLADIQTVQQPTTQKPTEKVIVKKEIAKTLPEKKAPRIAKSNPVIAPTIQPEPAIEAQNSETPVEENFKPVPEGVETAQEEPLAEPIADEPVTTPIEAPVAEKAVEQPVEKVEAAAPVVAASAPATENASAPLADTPAAAPAATPEKIQVTQNYLGLRQVPGNKPPVYAREMRLNKMQGRGQLVYFVNKNGQVSQVRVTQSTGFEPLDQAAVAAFAKYKFIPGQEGYTVHNFEFTLKGPAQSDAGRLRTTLNR